jgi:hypothetical protein
MNSGYGIKKLLFFAVISTALAFSHSVRRVRTENTLAPCHIVFSSAMILETNESDARAEIEVLAKTLGKAEQIQETPSTAIRDGNGPLLIFKLYSLIPYTDVCLGSQRT